MKLAKNTKVTFVELPGTELHRYYLRKKKDSTPVEIVGVTTMMKRLGLSHGYGHVNPDVLARAASRGTAIHELFQGYEMQGLAMNRIHFEWDCLDGTHREEDEDVTGMMKAYAALSSLNFKPLAVEYLVSDNESVASMADFISEVDDNTVDLVDYKSSSSLDKEALAWQLSFYKFFFERQNKGIRVRRLLGVHCHNEKVKLVHVSYKGDRAVEDALEMFKAGPGAKVETEVPALLTMQEILPDYPKLPEQLALKRKLEATLKEMDAQMGEAVAQLKDKMLRENILEVSVPGGRYVLTPEHTAQRFDSKALREKEPQVFDKYCTQSSVAASLKFYAEK